ncbi:alpha/beta hydrolase [Acetobacter nitrogenifigens DSM 23921 = NBRC 105050]|uniref:Alpha/beta hydrolase fold-3 domain-containing protein n=1 Tax=Acetobacter nitrogenifigens DSM 23921 = NBRC 105050 TaxID=1120919 RepID=A0A511XFB5_9PROT|nr:alpha/beta hydrolase fold domain-containing protein [Acetobacter nitrogenifigens]GBQ94888.1 alpha/beta hydrolase [Acetobacter nitrogenifigens DSM 23921 = NBRC 105050]GEN61639.1 hypothetical protein ANI02nite_35230 [Acetobacter nitrogenifigens DSM 23921 = NBRC 105050]
MKRLGKAFVSMTAGLLSMQAYAQTTPEPPPVNPAGHVLLDGSSVPFSSLASQGALDEFRASPHGSHNSSMDFSDIQGWRNRVNKAQEPVVKSLEAQFPVDIRSYDVDGVPVSEVTPRIPGFKAEAVLIELHGGGFAVGEKWRGLIESIPIAYLGHFKVITVNYRMAPEARFPAGSEDAEKVYTYLLNRYSPSRIGIYGCSAGGIIGAEMVAALIKKQMPVPGAMGMFCSGALGSAEGDSLFVGALMDGNAPPKSIVRVEAFTPYFKGARFDDPLVSPVLYPDLLAKFPPALFITGTRDPAMSDASFTNNQMALAGVETEFHAWDGMRHSFFNSSDKFREIREARRIIVGFFAHHLLGVPRAQAYAPRENGDNAPSLAAELAATESR